MAAAFSRRRFLHAGWTASALWVCGGWRPRSGAPERQPLAVLLGVIFPGLDVKPAVAQVQHVLAATSQRRLQSIYTHYLATVEGASLTAETMPAFLANTRNDLPGWTRERFVRLVIEHSYSAFEVLRFPTHVAF